MTRLRRAFVAVVPPTPVLRAVESLVDSSYSPDDSLRWVARDQWHCTLKFHGLVADSVPLVSTLEESLRRRPAVTVRLGGAGAFPSERKATVVWLGLCEGAVELADLAATVEGATGGLGHPADSRPFRPHVTVARARTARDLSSLVSMLDRGPAGPPWTVRDVVLFDSDTRPSGAVHREVARITLAG